MRLTVAVVVLICLTRPVRAAADGGRRRPVKVTVVEPLPFSTEEIAQAVAARVPIADDSDGAAVLVVVGPAAERGIAVRVGDRSRVVVAGERRGADAARTVALVVADLALDDFAVPPAPPMAAAPPVAVVAPPVPVAHSRPLRLTAVAQLSKGAGAEEPLCYGLDAGLTYAARRALAAVALGVVTLPRQRAGRPDEAVFVAGVVRVLGGVRAGSVELLAGPFAEPYALGGTIEHDGVLVGGGALVRLAPPLSRRLRLVVALRADVFANRIRAVWTTGDAFATPRVDAALELGAAWDLGS